MTKATPSGKPRIHHRRINVLLWGRRIRCMSDDVDKRLKDVMDALQGKVGGNGPGKGLLRPLIDNDVQIYRATIEKMVPPGQAHVRGHLIIRKMGYGRK